MLRQGGLASKNAIERVRARVLARLDGKDSGPRSFRRTQVQLARELGIKKSSIHELLHGRPSEKKKAERGLLYHLDAIAKFLGVPVSALVHRGDTPLVELGRREHRMLAVYRRLDPEVQNLVVALSEHITGLLPEERQARRWWNKIRRIRNARDVDYVAKTIDDVLRAQHTRRAEGAGREIQDPVVARRRPTGLSKTNQEPNK